MKKWVAIIIIIAVLIIGNIAQCFIWVNVKRQLNPEIVIKYNDSIKKIEELETKIKELKNEKLKNETVIDNYTDDDVLSEHLSIIRKRK